MFMLTTTANPPMKTRRVQSTRRLFTVCSLKMDFSRQGELDFPLSSHPRNTAADLPFRGGPHRVSQPSGNNASQVFRRLFDVGLPARRARVATALPHRPAEFLSVAVQGLPPDHRSPCPEAPASDLGDFYLTHAPSLLNLKHRGD